MASRLMVKCKTQSAYDSAVSAVASGTAFGIAVTYAGGRAEMKHDGAWLIYAEVATVALLHQLHHEISKHPLYTVRFHRVTVPTVAELFAEAPVTVADAYLAGLLA